MRKLTHHIESLFIRCTGYTYSNLARLFMRLFVGIMFLQFGIRHLMTFSTLRYTFPSVLGWSSETSLIVMITIELVCSLFIMVGFLTRLAVIPPVISMIIAEYYLLHDLLSSTQPGYLPIMFIGIFLFLLLAGPGKISLDYFISIFLISQHGKDESEELDEV